eukprot:2109400-Amphidinium_carterae.1
MFSKPFFLGTEPARSHEPSRLFWACRCDTLLFPWFVFSLRSPEDFKFMNSKHSRVRDNLSKQAARKSDVRSRLGCAPHSVSEQLELCNTLSPRCLVPSDPTSSVVLKESHDESNIDAIK